MPISWMLTAMTIAVPLQVQAVTDAPDPYVQPQTGMRFPARVGNFERHEVDRYNADGSDIGVGYDLILEGAKVGYVSMFVYPAPDTAIADRTAACGQLFESIKNEVLSHDPNTKLNLEQMVSAPSALFRAKGLRATFSGASAKFAGTEQPTRDEAYLYCFAGDKWLVAYRITWPAKYDITAEVKTLMAALVWTPSLTR